MMLTQYEQSDFIKVSVTVSSSTKAHQLLQVKQSRCWHSHLPEGKLLFQNVIPHRELTFCPNTIIVFLLCKMITALICNWSARGPTISKEKSDVVRKNSVIDAHKSLQLSMYMITTGYRLKYLRNCLEKNFERPFVANAVLTRLIRIANRSTCQHWWSWC